MRVVATLDQATVDRQSSAPKHTVVVSAAIGSTLIGLFCLLLARRAHQAADGRKAAEAMQARLVASLDAVPVEYIEFDSNKRMIHANFAARRSQNWSSDPAGKTMRELLEDTLLPVRIKYPETDWDAWLDERVARFDEGGMFEVARASGDFGRFYTVDLPGGGRVVLRVDITESKRREAELAAAQDRYRMLFDANAYPMVVIDRETRDILAVNDAAVAQYGWSREEALAMTSDDFYPPEDLRQGGGHAAARRYPRSGPGPSGTAASRRDGTIIDVELQRPQDRNGRQARHPRDHPERHRTQSRRAGAPGGRRAAAPVAEDGSGRAAHRRHRPRLQQHPHGDPRQRRCAAGGGEPRRRASPAASTRSARRSNGLPA